MNLARFARRHYTSAPTPIEKMARLSHLLDGPTLYVKRDDLLGLAAGGNKTRKLEFLVADALAEGADTLITCGAIQSNHCRLTLSAAVKEGLKCRLVLEERVPGTYREDGSGNNFLFQLLGVESLKVVPGGSDMAAAMKEVADAVRAKGGKPYIIPGGGSNPIGATGYVACAQEILSQAFELGLELSTVVCPSGSSGTHAGLVAGFTGSNSGVSVVGINVSRPKRAQEELVFELVERTAERLGFTTPVSRDSVVCYDDYVGEGYSLPTKKMGEAVRLFARQEAVLLDPVYTGKAAAGLIDLVRKGAFKKNEAVLFVHTGGSPALYAYREDVLD